MSTFMNSVQKLVARHTTRSLAAAAGLAAMIATSGHAAPVEYVKVCSLYGAGFFYIPGTDTCVDARQIAQSQYDVARAQTRSATGTAMAASLVAPWLPAGTNYAIFESLGGVRRSTRSRRLGADADLGQSGVFGRICRGPG